MKKYILLSLNWLLFCSMLFAYEETVNTPKEEYSAEIVMEHMEMIFNYYAPSSFEHFRDTVYVDIERDIQSYIKGIKDSIDLEDVEDYMYDMIIEASQTEYGEEDVIRYSSIYLMSGYNSYAHIVYQALATAYANLQDKDNLSHVLHCFENSNINQDGEFDYIIADMREQMESILYPKDLGTYARGIWVSDIFTAHNKYGSFPYSIIEIRSLTDDGIYSLNLPSFDNTMITPHNKWKDFRMAQRVVFDKTSAINNGRISATFSSQYFQQGLNTSGGFEQTRQMQANMEGTIAASKWTAGEKIAASALTTVTAGLMNWLMLELAQSSQTIATMTFNLEPVSRDVMSGKMEYIYHTFSTSRPNEEPEPIFDDNVKFLRWLPEDSVYFVNSQGKIFSVTAPENLDLSEYERLTKRWNKIRNYITLGSSVTGLGLMAGGIALACTRDDLSSLLGGIYMAIIGEVIVLVPPLVLYNKSISSKMYKQINEQQLKKLREKRQATISLSPTLNPVDASAGVTIGIKY